MVIENGLLIFFFFQNLATLLTFVFFFCLRPGGRTQLDLDSAAA